MNSPASSSTWRGENRHASLELVEHAHEYRQGTGRTPSRRPAAKDSCGFGIPRLPKNQPIWSNVLCRAYSARTDHGGSAGLCFAAVLSDGTNFVAAASAGG